MTQTVCFGLIRETLPNERRVALTPEGAERLTSAGHAVLVESGAGENAGFEDGDYRAVGARVCLNAAEVGHGADVLVKLHGPSKNEHQLIRDGGAVTGFLHLASPGGGPIRALIRDRKLHAIAWELVEEGDGSRPVLEAVSAIGGRVAVLLACQHLMAKGGGTGRLLGGAPGVPPLNVVVIGAGAAGEAAAREAKRLGAVVRVLDQDARALTRVSRRIEGIITDVTSARSVDRAVAHADLLITAVATAGRPAPKVVSRKQVRSMPADALIIDMSVDEGGCCETTRLDHPEGDYVVEGVRHLSLPNLPSEVARTASIAFTQATLPYLLALGQEGVSGALSTEPALYRGAVYVDGELRNSVVSELTGEPLGR